MNDPDVLALLREQLTSVCAADEQQIFQPLNISSRLAMSLLHKAICRGHTAPINRATPYRIARIAFGNCAPPINMTTELIASQVGARRVELRCMAA